MEVLLDFFSFDLQSEQTYAIVILQIKSINLW